MVVSIDFLQTWSGTCWQTGLLLNIKYQTLNLVSAPQGTRTNPSLFFATFLRLLKGENKGIHCFPGPLCCLRQCSKRETLETHAKNKTPQYLRDIIRTMYTGCLYLLIDGDKISEEVAPNRGLNRAALWVPYYTPFITMTWTDSWLYIGVLPLPWIQFKSLTVIMLMTSLSLQTRLKVCNSNWTNSMTIHVSKGSSSTLTKQKSWSSLAVVTLRFQPSRTTAHLWNLSLNWWWWRITMVQGR